MGYYVYITDQCVSDARRYGLMKNLEDLKTRLQKEQRTCGLFDNFPLPYLKKRFRKQERLIAAERFITIEGECNVVVCFYRVLTRGGDPYSKYFLKNPGQWGGENLQPLIPDGFLEDWLGTNQDLPAPEKKLPDEFEKPFLWDIMSSRRAAGKTEMIYESPDWIDAFKEGYFKQRLINVPDSILNLCTSEETNKIVWPLDKRTSIMARMFPEDGRIFLIAPVLVNDLNRIEELQKEYAEILESDCTLDEETLARRSGRAYPYELLLDEDLWSSAEQDEVANLALSAEEATLLEDVHRYSPTSHQGTGLPLFINGRAGSGKSTILQYLFADYLRHYLLQSNGRMGKGLLYLTCSPELLERSRESIRSLVALNPANVNQQEELTKETIKGEVENSAREFHAFLYSLLTDTEKRDKFPRYSNKEWREEFLRTADVDLSKEGHDRIDYAIFVRMWEKSFAQNPGFEDYTPELVWHVIRTYIKGMSTDDPLDVDDYQELDKSEKSVSHETFRGVYNTVWEKYSKECKKKQLWDDQDLARFLLMEDRISGDYVAIFCDEAQDFTRIELEILLRLSVFSERKLTPEAVSRVPFVFAGDPFQTLNPTGFRWEAVKATFFQKFIASLDPSRQTGRADINYRELHYNYRSTPNIVKFTNSIQALRSYLFRQPGIEPQIPWQHGNSGNPPCWFNWDGPNNLKEKIEQNKDIVIIIPCKDGEETSFVKEDARLSAWIPTDASGVPQNVLSAIRAKGLEFDRVALYGFGSHAPQDLLQEQEQRSEHDLSLEWILPREYFINRLYVAASRGKKQLFVIDSDEGYRNLWRIFEHEHFDAIVESFSENEQQSWKDNLGDMLLPGTDDSWNQNKGDPRKNASEYEIRGKMNKDPYFLRSAAIIYESLKDAKNAALCRAIAHTYEGDFEKSGDEYKGIGDSDQALEMYWTGVLYSKITELAKTYPNIQQSLEYRFIDVLQKKNVVLIASIFLDLEALLKEQITKKKIVKSMLSWKNIIKELLDITIKLKQSDDTAIDWSQLCDVSSDLADHGYVTSDPLAFLYFQTGAFEKAIETLDKAKKTTSKLYRLAKARLVLEKLKADPDHPLTDKDQKLMSQYYHGQGKYLKAAEYAAMYHGIRDIEDILNEVRWKQQASIPALVSLLLKEYADYAEWKKLTRYLDAEKLKLGNTDIPWQPSSGELWDVRKMIVNTLASSNELSNAERKNIINISRVVREWCQKPDFWDHLHPIPVGAVLERVARDIDCLAYYEKIFENASFKESISVAAHKRWLVCKLRQIKRENEQPKTRGWARKHIEELSSKKIEWGIEHPEREPDFPDLEKINMGEDVFRNVDNEIEAPNESAAVREAEGPMTENLGGLTVTYDRKTGRMKVQKGEFDSISIHAGERTCTSVDVDIQTDGDIHTIKDWNFQCDFSAVKTEGKFTVSVGKTTQRFTFEDG